MTIEQLAGPEVPPDVLALVAGCFDTPGEARLVAALHAAGAATVSLVAREKGVVVGHCLLSPVTLEAPSGPQPFGLGLAPVCVAGAARRKGIGLGLVLAGLEASKRAGACYAVVLGRPAYYGRAGFIPAHRLGLRCIYPAPEDAFMVLELVPGALAGQSGLVRYHPVFDTVGV